MSHVLTLTQIPEDKFRHFSRFPHTAATKTDESFNNVSIQSKDHKDNKKSIMKVAKDVGSKNWTGGVKFDLQQNQSALFYTTKPFSNVRLTSKGDVVHQKPVDDTEGLWYVEKVKINPEVGDIAKVKLTKQHPDTITQKEINERKSKDKRITTDLELVKASGTGPISDEFQLKLKNLEALLAKSKVVNGKRKPYCLVRNSRFGGDTKVTAYRPCTSLDTFRRERLEVIRENPKDDIDREEGDRIWAEVNAIIKNSESKQKRMGQQLYNRTTKSHDSHDTIAVAKDTEQYIDNTEELDYAMELRPLLGHRDEKILISTEQWNLSNKTSLSDEIVKGKNTFLDIVGDERNHPMSNFVSTESMFRRFRHKNGFSKLNSLSNNTIKMPLDSCLNLFDSNVGTDASSEAKSMTDYNKRSMTEKEKLIHQISGQCNDGPLIHMPTERACSGKAVTMTTTTLPRITPTATPLPTGVTQPPPRSHSSASMYRPYPPRELSGSFDFLRMPGRINPLAPPPPRKRINWSWETTDQHYENEKRSLLMQKREHTRYHSAWGKAFYGAPAEKEAYRRHFREVLKQQMADKNVMEKMEFKDKIRETEQAISYDRECRVNDATEYHRRHSYLMQYRDVNKKQMEDRWATNRYDRELENRIDRERLRYNPINWSCSLK